MAVKPLPSSTPKRAPRAAAAGQARLTLSLPEDTVRRLAEVAQQRGVSLDSLFEEMATLTLFEADITRRFAAPETSDA
ncbi:hypothetical protein RA210_U40007 [Rubrivivax sp. A210]|uniref:ribbon-helix-helix protein, CopG family n=1 Tax=Rubrivivax sp. A210 TaxID=2772301 RepID=UPI00191B6C9A|nr:ribbon-helix-helix protein, CopG family [Rubrivivax sp. A210]CAD5373604.1 hypothetical protein RA210_U40007 [Rubrivivax sp. A210]